MMLDAGIHWLLEMSGALTLACILWGCNNASHKHGRIVGYIAHHRWARWAIQGVFSIVTAYITVQLIG